MEKSIINPWKWQDDRSYNQGVEVKHIESTLYCAGQAAVHPDGTSSDADMRTQLLLAMHNLEQVVSKAGYELKNIARLNIYTTNHPEFFSVFDTFTDWVAKNEIKQVSTVVEVKTLYETLCVELEATLVK
ncbi:RidA family protein [Dyadobacter psychrophilus]|uniref:Enamine deaminase RidA, house cleaning of reactive enamine intermediates, YjgF/YER057c/UK114 family n=1 Tax=Dyadobacter psychrophilus TaxID=651661 RepID=A0A1T5E147_9BACT|nr:RidA family protein [Dyadobacter psychrophilus]SKB77496.1 Enamine deaminase RidA, house cleaning of reactive enamine intermediates, YjgF/YER057c/UK114 family [Dyadobacter psychrophilus]